MIYDLEKRTTEFGKKIIDFANSIPITLTTKPLINQLIRAGTSIGANYREANAGSNSRKDFCNKIKICKKESNETIHWLEIISHSTPIKVNEAKTLSKEAHEYVLIFGKIILSTEKKTIDR